MRPPETAQLDQNQPLSDLDTMADMIPENMIPSIDQVKAFFENNPALTQTVIDVLRKPDLNNTTLSIKHEKESTPPVIWLNFFDDVLLVWCNQALKSLNLNNLKLF